MNRELIVSLLKKNIDDLILLTEGFGQMTTYPDALIQLAQLKTNDIKQYLYELGELKQNKLVDEPIVRPLPEPEEEVIQQLEPLPEPEEEVIPDLELMPEPEEEVIPDLEPLPEPEEEVIPDLEPLPEPEVEIQVNTVQAELPALEIPYEEAEVEKLVEDVDDDIETPVNQELTPVVEAPETRKTTLGETMNNGITRNDIHSTRESERFNNAMANKKIEDIRQAISIGDRFRFQRELFRNNGEEMNKMLSYINLLASFNEIEAFLQKKYGWEADNEAAKDFYAIVRRKFL